MRKGTKFLIRNTDTGDWDTEVTVTRVSGNICTFEYDEVPRQQWYWNKYQEMPTLIYKFSDGMKNKNVRIIQE